MFPNSSSPIGMQNAGSRGYKAANPDTVSNGGGYHAYAEAAPTYGAPRNSPVRIFTFYKLNFHM